MHGSKNDMQMSLKFSRRWKVDHTIDSRVIDSVATALRIIFSIIEGTVKQVK